MNYKRYLITGGAGFIGSNYCNRLRIKNPDCIIVIVDKMSYCASMNNLICDIDEKKTFFYKTNILNYEYIENILQRHKIECIVHFAAESHVDNSFCNSISFTENNVLGTHMLLEACRSYNQLKLFVHISTDEVYGEIDLNHKVGYYETQKFNPSNPYAASKAAAEIIVRSYEASFKMPIMIIRANNNYGPNQYPEKIIPKFIQLLQKNLKLTIHGKGISQRYFIHVYDTCDAIDTIIDKGTLGECYNISSSDEFSVMEIATLLISKFKESFECIDDHVEYVTDRNFNDIRYCINSDKLKSLGWSPSIPFSIGIDDTIAWYNQHQNHFDT